MPGPVEANEGKIDVGVPPGRWHGPEKFLVQTSVQRKLIVGDYIGTLLCLREMVQNDDRHFLQVQLPCREKTATPGDDAGLSVNEHRVVEPERVDTGCTLCYWFFRVRSGIVCVGA